MDFLYLVRISQLIDNPSLVRPILVKALETSKPIVEKQYDREAPRLSGLLKAKVHSGKVWSLSNEIFYTITTFASNRGFRYPVAVAGGTGVFRGSSHDSPAPPNSGRVLSGESKTNRGSGGIRPNMFAKRAAIGAQFPVNKHIFLQLKTALTKVVQYTNG